MFLGLRSKSVATYYVYVMIYLDELRLAHVYPCAIISALSGFGGNAMLHSKESPLADLLRDERVVFISAINSISHPA